MSTPKDTPLKAGLDWSGDGVELSLRGVNTAEVTPIFVLWGTVDGTFQGSTAMGASAAQIARLQRSARYAARLGDAEWTCEWQLPFAALGMIAAPAKGLKLNVGLRTLADDSWAAWVPTGGRVCEVDLAGEVQLRN
ncbi:MAG: hypothetical protein COZ06_11785 [Armatimonadetes bacterium CG_4_10_14_3_um_filter_66_18]|nr:hypothetical protein [Armatimonadota bacterium]OIP11150.1 MAG: hypothetical protein AUJ96_02820 [Armatimonadetes bacterium CG2_30_66_41]PIU91709.1 MAG: hypothetical protein COS65_21140 [Armatimonadetes bacterium CG06_land_8_20_14_3_00_66_21]PIX47991.1 MAG: hypothetical protein COZ57_06870 [Armatimonadetes bacterium CG_4_8_14_3_um_filter_66_20]PIY49986.1 MAG: hypothetical protein COZ06_11785 [Armatimonadetes bacterium CG_4_10_14_3_um_filter_66_18]PIZ44030.1 MAG: hypothetical protein COY42_14